MWGNFFKTRSSVIRGLIGMLILGVGFSFYAQSTGSSNLNESQYDITPEPGNPVDVLKNNEILENVIFSESPDEWGGAYVDGDVLVVLTVAYDLDTAKQILNSHGVTEAVEFRRVAYSIQDLDEAVEDLSKSLPKGSWSFMGPDYVKNSVTVTVPKSQLDSFADGITVDGYPDMQVNVLEGEFAVAV